MCFSVTASFTASLALITCGVAALNCAREKKLRMIAAIPLIFGAQQCAEGFVWFSFLYPSFAPIRMAASYIFLTCAGVVWPLWIPMALARFEDKGYKRYVPSLVAGVLCALAFIVYALFYPIAVTANCNVIYYFDVEHTPYGAWHAYINGITSLLYIIATIVPFFITRNKTVWLLGALIAIAYVVSYVAYFEAFGSVWCFFAALISILVYGLVRDKSHKII
jgi:hypothetical protein